MLESGHQACDEVAESVCNNLRMIDRELEYIAGFTGAQKDTELREQASRTSRLLVLPLGDKACGGQTHGHCAHYETARSRRL
jgi:hypothetical protein